MNNIDVQEDEDLILGEKKLEEFYKPLYDKVLDDEGFVQFYDMQLSRRKTK